MTLALVPNDEPRKYGGVLMDAGGRVTGFAPRGPKAEGSFHFVGVQIAGAEAFAMVPDGRAVNSVVCDHGEGGGPASPPDAIWVSSTLPASRA